MTTILSLISCDEVRGILGVSSEEIEDVTVAGTVNWLVLQETLLDIHTSLLTYFTTLQAQGSRTANEQRYVDIMQAYSNYVVAQILLGAVRMFAPQTVQDSKSQFGRVADPYADLKDAVLANINYLQNRLGKLYAVLNPGATIAVAPTRILVVVSGIPSDPVTGV